MILRSLLLALVITAPTYAQHGREIITPVPAWNAIRANAPIGQEHFAKNEGGSDGAGLCVYTSNMINGSYQKVGDLDKLKQSAYWAFFKSRPGGSYPQKWARDIAELEKKTGVKYDYFSYVGPDASVLERVSKAGVPMGATMNTGAQYQWQRIAHMISLIHFDKDWACVLDNNFKDAYSWMTAKEFMSRQDGGKVWATWWLKPAPQPAKGTDLTTPIVLGVCGVSVLVAIFAPILGRKAA